MKVLITSNSFGKFDNGPRQRMLDLGWELVGNRHQHIMNEAEMKEEVQGIDAIILGSDTVNKHVLEQANKLKIISRYGVGLDNVDLEVAKAKKIEVTVTKNCNTEAVADYTIGLMLAMSRHICSVDSHLKQGKWIKETGLDISHKTVGVFGLGAIGRQVVKRLKGFDCKILGYDKFIDEAYCEQNGIEIVDPKTIFEQADIITLHIPGNADGSYFINKEELSLMKATTVLVNTARASLINENDLLDALQDHKLYGYATDVFVNEPHINEKFKHMDNVILSPHNAAVSVEAINKMSNTAVDHLIAYFENEQQIGV